MSLKELSTLASSEVFFAVIFVFGVCWLAVYVKGVLQENRRDNQEREDQLIDNYQKQIEKSEERESKLMNHLDRNGDQLENISYTLKDVQTNLVKLESRVDENLTSVWKELGSKQDKI